MNLENNKKKQIKLNKDQYQNEKWPSLDEVDRLPNELSQLRIDKDERPRSRVVSFGWAGEGRSGLGNCTIISVPSHVKNCLKIKQPHQANAGKYHSLIRSEDGNVFTIGEGTFDQLGRGSLITKGKKNKDVIRRFQWFPKQVFPSGHLSSPPETDFALTQTEVGWKYSLGF